MNWQAATGRASLSSILGKPVAVTSDQQTFTKLFKSKNICKMI